MTTLIDRWGRDRPFLLALVALLVVVIPGFLRLEHIADEADQAAATARIAARSAQAQVDQNTALIECLTTYAGDLTDSLQDRDVVTKTARAAAEEWLATFERLVRAPDTPDARGTFLAAITRYQRILDRLDRAAAINPYPDIAACLGDLERAMVYTLVANTTGRIVCFGRTPTIRGTGQGDVIHGTDKQDVIRAFGGDDIVHGGKGNDYICGGRGDDTINGGQDYDRTRGNRGADFCIQAEKAYSC